MATTRKPAARNATALSSRVAPAKPSARLAATPAGKKAARTVKADSKAGKTARKAAPKAAAVDTAAKPEKAAKADKAKKPKLVRDSFTIPKAEYAVIDTLKVRAVNVGKTVKKSELLRAGLKALAALPDLAFVAALDAVPALKTGRPAKS